ncbi:response regulator transcription factor [Streptomyces sp. NPDC005574]|uniref:response regulator transcription factor n=1 Tax=Streptomyces sp. NPDC005574 TaxID=3156891 RepID=UPI0033AC3834
MPERHPGPSTASGLSPARATGTTAVLVVSDQALQRLGLRMLLTAQSGLSVAGEASGGTEAVRASDELRPDVVLLDGRMPDGGSGTNDLDGTAVIATIRRITHPRALLVPPVRGSAGAGGHAPRLLLLGTGGLDAYAHAALRAGAGGFLPENALPAELVAAVRAVAAGNAVIPPGLTRELIDVVRRQGPAPTTGQELRLGSLTGRERDVLTAVASGWSNAEIARRLSIAPTTVKSHVSNILTKIGARARVQAVVFAYESGLVRPP